jgi:PleD family two-component response regulator
MGINDRSQPKVEPLTILDFGTEFNKELPAIRILVADDDPPSRMLLQASLTQWGYKVTEASDGEEAWRVMQEEDPPRLLILDWLMPKLDGINLCTKIRKELPESSSYYIILLSQITGNSNIKLAIDGGANEFLSKPFDYQELRSRVFSAARLIQYEIKLSEENKRLSSNTSLIKELSIQILALSKKLEEMQASTSQLSPAQLQQMEELHALVERSVRIVRSLHL